MTPSFNLLDEPWIPVRLATGEVRAVGLHELFKRARDISALAETSPPNLVALYRLLLAITHRALLRAKGDWRDRDRAQWYRDGIPARILEEYLEHWRDRFWLFHSEHPFMQVAALSEAEETREKTKPWTQIALDATCGNAPVLFDHAVDASPTTVSLPQAMRHLLGFLQFTPGGLVRVIRGADNAGALANTAAVLPLGSNLNQTLCQALHPSNKASEHDLPAWEQEPPTIAMLSADSRLATGPNDRYTRLSRAVLLLPEQEGSGICLIRFGAGIALAEDAIAPDPMATYRVGTNGPVRLSFSEGRAVWRDLASLLPDASGKYAIPAAILAWAANLQDALGAWDNEAPILVAGLASDQAKLLRWRSELIVLPRVLLLNLEAGQWLRQKIKAADDGFFRLRGVAGDMIAETMPDSASKDTRSRARAVLDTGPCAATFFSVAERALPLLMERISQGNLEAADTLWRETLGRAAQAAWEATCHSLGSSANTLRAQAVTHYRLHHLLRELRGEVEPSPQIQRQPNSSPAKEAQS